MLGRVPEDGVLQILQLSVRGLRHCINHQSDSILCAFSFHNAASHPYILYSRRYGGISSTNCFLSGVDARDLLTQEDLVADQDHTIYAQKDNADCRNSGFGGGTSGNTGEEAFLNDFTTYQNVTFNTYQNVTQPLTPLVGCYRVERRDTKFYISAVANTYKVRDLKSCSGECHRSSNCKTFAFR